MASRVHFNSPLSVFDFKFSGLDRISDLAFLRDFFKVLHNKDVGGDWAFAGDGAEARPTVAVLETEPGHRDARGN